VNIIIPETGINLVKNELPLFLYLLEYIFKKGGVFYKIV